MSYKSPNYDPSKVVDAFVKWSNYDKCFHFCERDERKQYDVRQGVISADLIPEDIKAEAIKRSGIWPSYVEVDKALTLQVK